ncbi:hypothetical protein [Microbulbifer sp. SSSA005]|uniref:hypothetical protein n=1 Tax=unclassified Microbulbifer TaxID=2619833 RepID=UPI00403922AA
MKLEIDNYWELLALHKSMMAVKFDKNSCLKEAQGSPYTGRLAFKIFDLLLANCNEKQRKEWLEWQLADESRIETQLLKKHIADSNWWVSSNIELRESFVRDFMAPLTLEQQLFHEVTTNC